MKIFVTGATGATTDTRKIARTPIIEMTRSLVQDLRYLGHDVEWGPVDGADIPDCDLMISTPCPLFSPFVPWAMAATYGMALAWKRGIPTVVYFDDWQFPWVWYNYDKFWHDPLKQLHKTRGDFPMYAGDHEAMAKHADLLGEYAHAFATNDPALWDTSIAYASKFKGWGDIQIFRDIVGQQDFHSFDPSPLVYEYVDFSNRPTGDRYRRWMHAGLKTLAAVERRPPA